MSLVEAIDEIAERRAVAPSTAARLLRKMLCDRTVVALWVISEDCSLAIDDPNFWPSSDWSKVTLPKITPPLTDQSVLLPKANTDNVFIALSEIDKIFENVGSRSGLEPAPHRKAVRKSELVKFLQETADGTKKEPELRAAAEQHFRGKHLTEKVWREALGDSSVQKRRPGDTDRTLKKSKKGTGA